MGIPEVPFRHILIFYFRKGKNAAQSHRKLCGVYGDDCLREASVRIGLLVFVPKISMLKMDLALAGQSLKKLIKFLKKLR